MSAVAVREEPRARFSDLVAAESIKLRSLRSTLWAFVLSGLAVVGFNAGQAYNHYKYWGDQSAEFRAEFIPRGYALLDAFTTDAGLIMMLAAGSIGAIAITGEYSTGLIRATFAAVPARRSVMAAKVAVITMVMTLFGAVVAVLSFLVTQMILAGRDVGISIGDPGALRVVTASALLAPVAGLAGVAMGALLRSGPVSVVCSFVLLLMLPLVISDGRRWTAVVDHALPLAAWMRLVDVGYSGNGPYPAPEYPWTITGAWLVYAVWALATAAIAVTVVRHRDQ